MTSNAMVRWCISDHFHVARDPIRNYVGHGYMVRNQMYHCNRKLFHVNARDHLLTVIQSGYYNYTQFKNDFTSNAIVYGKL